jgi:predicted dehydrogenase
VGFVENGGAFIGLHSATASWQDNAKYIDMVGGVFSGHGPVIDFPVEITGEDSVITRRIPSFRITDELYTLKKHDAKSVKVLATAHWKGETCPMAYTKSYGKGRVFYLALGHDERAFAHAEFQKMARRGVDWALGRKERKPLKIGCIGYSDLFNMGKLHLTSLRDAAGFEPVAVCDLRKRIRENAEKDFPGIKTYASYKKMLKESDIELVVIITEHNTHANIAVDCLKAGRHVVTEKPFSVTVKEADTMIAAGRKSGTMLSVFHNRRWDGDYMTVKDIIARGLIGEPFHIEATMGNYDHPSYWWRSDKKISGGAFYDWGAHVCDWVLGLAPSPIKEVSGFFQKKLVWHDVSNEDHCNAAVRFANGLTANIELSHLASIEKPRWRILGTKGGLQSVGDDKFRVVTYKEGVKLESEIDCLPSDWHAYYRNVADHLMLDEELSVTPESARRVIALIETAEKSSSAGKAMPMPRHCV